MNTGFYAGYISPVTHCFGGHVNVKQYWFIFGQTSDDSKNCWSLHRSLNAECHIPTNYSDSVMGFYDKFRLFEM